jgi:hypothetical protein
MTDNFNYSLVKNSEGTYSVRSTVRSFNLDHVTDKDIVSFYRTFSEYASFDTGLLPLDGTGVLAIRTAGSHTQIVTQHAPGNYHINWGTHEGDKQAVTYYVAQPYRIVIGDFENGQLLGARMFYSPYPITSPDNVLYHVNLPNINCQGYRGNGVGWICLYRTDDWSKLPFNEKVSRFIERCSGVETYNDQNMSDTDGPRFYAANDKPSYTFDPNEWESKSVDGFLWTLDPNLWIPVLVQDIDNQDKHYVSGQPLTLAMAMLGDYQAYYTDINKTKMYNVISRLDKDLSDSQIANFFKSSFALAPVKSVYSLKDNPYKFTVESRQENGQETLTIPLNNDDDDTWDCQNCEDSFTEEPTNTDDGPTCSSCLSEAYVYIKSANNYFNVHNDYIIFSENDATFYHTEHDSVFECDQCGEAYCSQGLSDSSLKKLDQHIYIGYLGNLVCKGCFLAHCQEQDLSYENCNVCSKNILTQDLWSNFNPKIKYISENSIQDVINSHLCHTCASHHYVCPCGFLSNHSSSETVNCTPTTIDADAGIQYVINQCCNSCLGSFFIPEGSEFFESKYSPSQDIVSVVISNKIYENTVGTTIINNNNTEQLPF